MWGKSFHKLCGFQGILYKCYVRQEESEKDTMGVKTVRRSDTERRETRNWVECPRKHETTTQHNWLQLLHIIILFAWPEIPAMHISMHRHINAQIYTHKWTIQGMLTATAPYAPSVLRGNLRNGTMRNFRYLKQSFTFLLVKGFKLLLFSETHSSPNAACVLHILLIQCFD